MNTFKTMFVLSFVSLFASATNLHPDTFSTAEVAKRLVTLQLKKIGIQGTVLKSNRMHPYTHFLVAIPAEVILPDACTEFVGQNNSGLLDTFQVDAMGVKNPLMDVCIEILPEPVETQFTIDMSVLTGGFIPAGKFHEKFVSFGKLGTFKVTLDLYNETVTVEPVKSN